MEFEPLTTENEKEWNNFCLQSNSAWFRHTTYWMKYIMDCREDSNSKNLSFMVKQNGKIIAVVPLISQYIYSDKENDEFANYDTPVPIMAIKNDNVDIVREKVFEEVQKYIDELAIRNKIKIGKFFIDPLLKNNICNNFDDFNLLKFSYFPDLKTTSIIDLTVGEDSVLRQMRKGHKADIKSVFRDNYTNNGGGWRVDIFDYKNIGSFETSVGIMENIHFIDSGRKTRTEQSWVDMYEWIKNKMAFLVLVWSNDLNRYTTAGLFMNYKDSVYYASYATIDSSLFKGKVGYVVQWSAIKYMIENGFSKYETGWNYYPANFKEKPDDKVMQISSFKRGFGGKEYLLLSFYKEYGNL